ncbi:MAG: hypothetical protein G01um10142_233 [Parcubacteria group bacterium Gr01-1014_2]|nr:MAG: hypothetical protein G01um10142_233 [Parcubacteria group bacterium Gr01-1014_2]
MLLEANFLIVRYEPAIGALIRAAVEKDKNLIIGKRQWQEKTRINLVLTLNVPDTDDDGEKLSFMYSVERFTRRLEDAGALVEARKNAT